MKTNTFFSKPLTYMMLTIIITCFSCAPIHRSNLTLAPDSNESSNGEWSEFYTGASAGYGSNSIDDYTVSSFCVGAEIMYNFCGSDDFGLYGGIFGNYNSSSSDNVDENYLKGGVRGRLFDHIIPSQRLQAVYGVDAYAISGKREFSMSEDDISGFGGSAIAGLNLDFPKSNFSVGFEASLFDYRSETYKYDGGEVDVNTTSFGLNKNNLVMAYLRLGF